MKAAETSREAMLRRAVEISLLTWRRAEPDDRLDDAERMGWWGDSFPAVAGDRIGSRLWLLRREKITPEVLRRAQTYAREALQWMVDDELVATVNVELSRRGATRVDLLVTLTDDGGDPIPLNFDDFWQVLHAV